MFKREMKGNKLFFILFFIIFSINYIFYHHYCSLYVAQFLTRDSDRPIRNKKALWFKMWRAVSVFTNLRNFKHRSIVIVGKLMINFDIDTAVYSQSNCIQNNEERWLLHFIFTSDNRCKLWTFELSAASIINRTVKHD